MNLYKNVLQNHTFLFIDDNLASDNLSHVRNNLLERIDDKVRDENLQYDINRKTAKISALSSEKVDK